jgi:hypothetical protein
MHLLPLSLGRLADLADRRDTTAKFGLDAVLLRLNADNTFEAVATDAKSLARVTGPCVAPACDFPLFPELADAPDDGTQALIPADVWKRAFTWARKLTVRKDVTNPACRSVAVRIGAQETTFGVSDGEHPWWEAAPNSTGRFPPYADIIARAFTQPAGGPFAADPERLSQLLTLAAEFCPDRGALRVEIEPRTGNTPITMRGGQPGGLEFLGLVMPLTSGSAAPPLPFPSVPDAERLAALEQENESLRAECTELARQVTLLKDALANLK